MKFQRGDIITGRRTGQLILILESDKRTYTYFPLQSRKKYREICGRGLTENSFTKLCSIKQFLKEQTNE